MGITSWPCPSCGQNQTADHPNGEDPQRFRSRFCAACLERPEVAKRDTKERNPTREG